MQEFERIKVLFVAGFGPIVRDRVAGGNLYGETLNISFKKEQGGYLHTEALKGVRTFALWPLDQAAQSCFGKDSWPDNTPVPQAWLEFDVEDVEGATAELESRGYRLLIKNKKEPWGQTVTRFLSPEGLLVGLTITPSMRDSWGAATARFVATVLAGQIARAPPTSQEKGSTMERRRRCGTACPAFRQIQPART